MVMPVGTRTTRRGHSERFPPKSEVGRRTGAMARLPSLYSLRAFEAVARLGSMSLASGELSVTAGAISRHIKELESDLGVSIVERDGRGVRLTEEGKRLRNGLYPAFEMINRAVLYTRRDPRRKRLLVAVVPLFAENWLIPRLKRFKRMAPKIDVIVADRFSEAVAVDADIVIEWGEFESLADAEIERLTHEQIFPVCIPAMCPNRTLVGATLVHRHRFPNRYDFPEWPAFLGAAGLESVEGPDPHGSVSVSGGMVMDAARSGMGVALVNTTVAHDDLASGRLIRPIAHSMETEIGYWLLIPNAVKERSEVKAFRAWLFEELVSSFGQSAQEASELHTAPGSI